MTHLPKRRASSDFLARAPRGSIRRSLCAAMLLGLLKNVDGYVTNIPKIVYFEGSDTGATRFSENPSNLGAQRTGLFLCLKTHFECLKAS